jgi:hypothetical protein
LVGILIFVASILLLVPGTAAAEGAIGFFGGLNRSNLSGDALPKTSYTPRLGAAAGALGEFNLTEDVRLSFQPMFIQRGSGIAFSVPNQKEERDSLDLRLNYITLPVLVKIISGNEKTYATGGLNLGYLVSAEITGGGEDQDMSDALNRIDLAADFGFGVMLPIGSPLLTMELRYEQSMLNIANPEADSSGDVLPVRFRSTNFVFLVGLLFPLGGS